MITANWRIKCNVECPYCGNYIDLIRDIKDSFEWLPNPGVTEKIEQEIECTDCNRAFIVQNVEYQ